MLARLRVALSAPTHRAPPPALGAAAGSGDNAKKSGIHDWTLNSSARCAHLSRAAPSPPLARCTREGGEYAAARDVYLARFADAGHMFELADFSLFVIQPVALRFVAGYGKAFSPAPAVLARALDGT